MRSMKRFVVVLVSVMATLPYGAAMADESPIQTAAVFKANVYYQYKCNKDVFTIVIGAQNQFAIGGEASLYWEIWSSGAAASGGVENVASLDTIAVEGASGTIQANGFPLGSYVIQVYRPCSRQSLYLWPGSAAETLPGGNLIVNFANAAEEPLPLP
jgi:hypothetical protein